MIHGNTSTDSPIPRIDPVPEGIARPFWSVMLPCYNCSDDFEQALRSVLEQDPGAHLMQIAVVDDCSTNGKAEQVVQRLAPGRIEFHRQSINLGLTGNWNTCLSLSRGQWVHLLHQDDLVQPGFYEAMERATREHQELGAAFCQHVIIDDRGNWESLSLLERRTPGVLDRFDETLAGSQRIQCPSIVVRRAVYETLGGFNPELCFALDWEMWLRIVVRYPIWFEPRVLACYRKHAKSETARLQERGEDLADIEKGLAILRRQMPARLLPLLGKGVYPMFRDQALASATELLRRRDHRSGLLKLHEAIQFDPSLRFSGLRFAYYKWAAKLWLQELLRTSPAGLSQQEGR